jgi:hypothetical protein
MVKLLILAVSIISPLLPALAGDPEDGIDTTSTMTDLITTGR